jgi:type I restriction enzyme M protein
MVTNGFERKTKELIDALKGICASYGLGNDGNEYKIITQVFLYKFMNDKFAYEVKQIDGKFNHSEKWEKAIVALSDDEYQMLLFQLKPDTARLKPEHFISTLFAKQNDENFAKLFDDTLLDIAINNNDIFSVKTDGGSRVQLFDRLSEYIIDPSKRDEFCRALINQTVAFSFEHIFNQKYDFYATIFEYLISDYNKDGGGKYAEYYTPHAVAKIMAAILIPADQQRKVQDVTCYDPSAGSGTLLMNIAHAIGEDRCTIYSQDISQKSSSLLRLNLILNNLVHSIQNIIQGNTLEHPYHRNGKKLMKFDYIVSNPPFKMDFSDYRDNIDSKENNDRFFAGVPNIPKKAKDKMEIYTLFLQHIIFSLKENGKAAVVVPTGFLTGQNRIHKKIRQTLVEEKMLAGVVSMPSNIFATTGTSVSIIFLDKSNLEDVVLINAANLGERIKEGKNQKTILRENEERKIITTFNAKDIVDDFSIVVNYKQIEEKNYSFSAGQYFHVKIEHVDITQDEFESRIYSYSKELKSLFSESRKIEEEIFSKLKNTKYE